MQAQQDAQNAYQNSQISYLSGRIDALESRPATRESRQRGLDVDALRAQGAENWKSFKGDMDRD